MSWGGSSRHNTAAPGFSQAHDPFAGLSRNAQDDEAIDFEETYDGLGDQLDESGDAFNDDTFGVAPGASGGSVGKDFDFFGATSKVADAIGEESARFQLQQPAPSYGTAPSQPAWSQPQPAKPVRTGYEKYKNPEPTPELSVDRNLWGIAAKPAQHAPAQAVAPAPAPAPVQAAPPSSARKMMSLEEVEAAMRAQARPTSVSEQQPVQAPQQPHLVDPYILRHEQRQEQPFYGQDVPQPFQASAPIKILERPGSRKQASPLPKQQQQQLPEGIRPTQILQNPNRLSGDAARIGMPLQPLQPSHHSQNSVGRLPQVSPGAPSHMSDGEKAMFLEQEMKRAKRNHKIFQLSKDNGVMTPQDKNFITRIQLQQLVSATGNPAEGSDVPTSEDFYYQVYNSIRSGQRQNPSQPLSNFAQTYLLQTGNRAGGNRRHGRPAENHQQRMEQQVQRAVEAAKNKPKNPQLVIAGSLGKISFSNSKTPKPLLNIKRSDSATDTPRPGSSAKRAEKPMDRKSILRDVERLYDTLMQIEDHGRCMPPPLQNANDELLMSQHQKWAAHMEELNGRLWVELKVMEPIGATDIHPFIRFLSFPKGKRAIPRVFRHCNFEQKATILTIITYHLDQLDVVRGAHVGQDGEVSLNSAMRDSIDLFSNVVMPSLFAFLNETKLELVDGVLSLIATKLNVDLISRTRIGTSMLTMILSRAELLKQSNDVDPAHWQKWLVLAIEC